MQSIFIPTDLIDEGTNGYMGQHSFSGSTDTGSAVDEGNWNGVMLSDYSLCLHTFDPFVISSFW